MPTESAKIYVLDTSVLVQDPHAIDRLGDNIIVVPIVVIEELDVFKNEIGLRGASSREVSRVLDKYQKEGNLDKGVATVSGGKLIVDCNGISWGKLPIGLERKNDNAILLVAKSWQEKDPRKVILLSADINLRLKAAAWGIEADEYKNDETIKHIEELPSSQVDFTLSDDHLDIVNQLGKDKEIGAQPIFDACGIKNLNPNHCCRLFYGSDFRYLLAIYNKAKNIFRLVSKPKPKGTTSGIYPANDEQAFAYHLLNDPDITLVVLSGIAGTGKSLISLRAAYKLTLDKFFQKIVVLRQTKELGGDSLGYLPGTLEEKFAPWAKPIVNIIDSMVDRETFKKDGRSFSFTNELIAAGVLEIGPINFAQGITFSNSFILLDEAQNSDGETVKALITRSGEGSKFVMTGDLQQICGRRKPDPTSSGLARVIKAFQGQENFGHVNLIRSERSALAEQAALLL